MDDSEGEDVRPNLNLRRSQTQTSWFSFRREEGSRRPAPIDANLASAGSTSPPTANSPLFSSSVSVLTPHNEYGTLPRSRSAVAIRHGRARRTSLSPTSGRGYTNAPSRVSSPSIFQTFRRPKTAYDHVLEQSRADDTSAYLNGIRFYYSTYSSIDWLHDAIKDSTRVLRLRQRRSIRGRLANALDRSLGWIVVSIVGFLTAIVAFGIVRLEQWLFDIKGGYCKAGWWKAERFCCPRLAPGAIPVYTNFTSAIVQPFGLTPFVDLHGREAKILPCADWITWAEAAERNRHWPHTEEWILEYAVYTLFALLLAFISALLTIKLTASDSIRSSTDSASRWSNERDAPKEDKSTESLPKRKILYFASGSGIPELKTILGGFVMRGYLGRRTLITKAIALPLSVASGLTLGKEGPFVHIATCLGNIVSRWFNKYETNEAKRREILSAACAAGVAVAFGAPVGGVLFSLEEVSYFFPAKVMWRSFFCAMIAAATLRFLDPFGTGKLVLFQVTYDKEWHAFELWFFVILGIFGGLYGGYSTLAHVWWVKNVRSYKWIQRHPMSEVMMITLLTVLLTFLNPYTKMGGVELVYNLFAECHAGDWHEGLCVVPGSPIMPVVNAIAVAALIKAVLVTITFGIKVPAGIFIPTLGVGACAGRILGLAVQYLEHHHPDYSMFNACKAAGDKDCVIPGLYAMIGATAALSGVTRTTISLAVIVFELTRTMNYVVPVMLSVLVAKTLADFIRPTSLYDSVIEMNQLPYLECKHQYLWGSHVLDDLVTPRVDCIRADKQMTVEQLQNKLRTAKEEDGGYPVVVKDGLSGHLKAIGYIGNNELENALSMVADDPTAVCRFQGGSLTRDMATSYISVADGEQPERDPYDLSVYMDSSPVTVTCNSPLELVHQIFTKLGARYILVNNADGKFEGILDKKAWIAFVSEIPSA